MTTYSIQIEKAATSVDVDFDTLPAVSQERVKAYGLKQLLNDATAPVSLSSDVDGRRIALKGKDLDEARKSAAELVAKRLGMLKDGILAAPRGGGDPVAREAKRIAEAAIVKSAGWLAWIGANKPSASELKDETTAKAWAKAKADALAPQVATLAQRADVVVKAKARVAEMDEISV